MSFVIGIFGGLWTALSLFNLLSIYKHVVHRRLLIRYGQQCTGRLTHKFTRRVRTGKHGHRTAYLADIEFTTIQSISISGRLRRSQTISKELEFGHDVWASMGAGSPVEMVYLPMQPTICMRHPPATFGWFLRCWISLFVIPFGPPLGFVFVFFLARDITSLLIWLFILLAFLVAWWRGAFDSVGHGEDQTDEADEESLPRPSLHTCASESIVVGTLVGSSEDETAPLPQWVMSAGPAAGLGAVEPAADGVVDAAWRDLTLAQREAARVLGYTKRKWDRNKSVPADDKYWVDLSSEEQQAAATLGYTAAAWDAED